MSNPRYRRPPDPVTHHVSAIERRVNKLERVPRGNNTAIDSGDLTLTNGQITITNGKVVVLDNTGATVVELGLLGSSVYGLRVTDPITHAAVTLSSLAFGTDAASVATAESLTTAGFQDLATLGPEKVVNVSSGRAIVIVSAVSTSTAGTSAAMTFNATTADSAGTPALPEGTALFTGSLPDSLNLDIAAAVNNFRASRALLFSAGFQGKVRFTAKYSNTAGAGTATWSQRQLIVIPY